MGSRKVDILGQEYEVVTQANVFEFPLLYDKDGYMEFTTKRIVVADFIQEPGSTQDVDIVRNTVLRHEVVHAFLEESGLEEMAQDELLVNWIAMQFPKMLEVFRKLGCLSEDNKIIMERRCINGVPEKFEFEVDRNNQKV